MSLAQAANRYLDRKEPWKAVKEDRRSAATTLWVALAVINCLKTALYPVLPFSSARLHAMLGLDGCVEDQGWTWDPEALVGSSRLQNPEPLFVKLDDSIIEEESHRIGR